jgi:REP element-mobilizing transposase RayT
MKQSGYKVEYRRNLPHYQPQGATLFITIRLDGTLPRHIIEKLRSERDQNLDQIKRKAKGFEIQDHLRDEAKRHFGRFDKLLDRAEYGPTWMANTSVARIIYDELTENDGILYTLDAFTIMPNHCHIIFQPIDDQQGTPISLSSIMMSIKGRTARQCNQILQRNGRFWQHESYDHVIRNQAEWQRIIEYVLNNPVKAGLVERWENWLWSYLRDYDL